MSNHTEIRWHGRGGQGAKTAALLLADVAFQTGKYVQGFPEYGPERMGAPITAYNRISDTVIRANSNIYDPQYVVVVDESLLETVDVTSGLKEDGAILINTERPKEEIIPHLKGYKGAVYTIDARKISMAALFILTLVLCKVIFFSGASAGGDLGEAMSFGAAVELAVAMPLSWLPLISDYTREAEKPFQATLASTLTYGVVSCWMYVIGMGAAIYTGEYDIAQIMVKAGLGIAALVILVLSTVTTTFLDAWSAGISAESLSSKLNGKWTAVVVSVVGIAGAILFPMDDITGFLYLIGSVFAPMIAVQIADFFLLKKKKEERAFDWCNLVIWLVGFVLYRILMHVDFALGNTLPDMVLTVLICLAVNAVKGKKNA